MEEEKLQQLLPKLIAKLAKQLNPEVYSTDANTETIIGILNQNEDDKNEIMAQIQERSEAGELEQDLMDLEQEEDVMYAKKGGNYA